MILISDLIAQRDNLLKSKLRAQLLKRKIPHAEVVEAVNQGFKDAEAQWKEDLAKYHEGIARKLEELEIESR